MRKFTVRKFTEAIFGSVKPSQRKPVHFDTLFDHHGPHSGIYQTRKQFYLWLYRIKQFHAKPKTCSPPLPPSFIKAQAKPFPGIIGFSIGLIGIITMSIYIPWCYFNSLSPHLSTTHDLLTGKPQHVLFTRNSNVYSYAPVDYSNRLDDQQYHSIGIRHHQTLSHSGTYQNTLPIIDDQHPPSNPHPNPFSQALLDRIRFNRFHDNGSAP